MSTARRHKVVLYNPESVFYTMPLALVAVGSALDPARYDVRIIDGRLEHDPEQAVLRAAKGAICVGVTVLTGAPIRDALKISRAVKRTYPELPVIWGGWHPSLFPEETLKEPSVDLTVQGQGEVTFRELADRLADRVSYADVAGICRRENGAAVRNAPRAMTDMNLLPAHDYGLLPVERYMRLKGGRQIDYVSSTGCYWRCAFCADPFVYNRKWTALAPERIAGELAGLCARHRFAEVSFQDETFFTHRNRVIEVAGEFLRRGVPFTWTATMRADQGFRLDDGVFHLLARSGLRRVLLGVESGSQEMLDWMKKDITLEQVMDCAEKCVRHGIGGIFPFIVGFPEETDASVSATLEVAKRLRAMSRDFETPIFYFKPYPGSEITASVVRNGYRLPGSLEEWAEFDFIGSSGPWVDERKYRLVERFKFYNRAAWGRSRISRWPLRPLARWRCKRDFYRFPLEKALVERVAPAKELS